LLEFALLVASAVLLSFLHLLVLVFTPVDDFGYWRICVWRDFNQVKAGFFSQAQGFSTADNAKLFAALSDNAQLASANCFVDANCLVNVPSPSVC